MLLYSLELKQKDINKFYDFFYTFIPAEANLQKINMKCDICSKQIFNLNSIIIIQECYKYNRKEFELNYEKIINNLIKQTYNLYSHNYNGLYKEIFELNQLFSETFKEKGEEYSNLLFYIF